MATCDWCKKESTELLWTCPEHSTHVNVHASFWVHINSDERGDETGDPYFCADCEDEGYEGGTKRLKEACPACRAFQNGAHTLKC